MGYDGVEFAGLYNYTGDEVRAMLDEDDVILQGLVPPFVFIHREEIRNYVKEAANGSD